MDDFLVHTVVRTYGVHPRVESGDQLARLCGQLEFELFWLEIHLHQLQRLIVQRVEWERRQARQEITAWQKLRTKQSRFICLLVFATATKFYTLSWSGLSVGLCRSSDLQLLFIFRGWLSSLSLCGSLLTAVLRVLLFSIISFGSVSSRYIKYQSLFTKCTAHGKSLSLALTPYHNSVYLLSHTLDL